MGYEEEQAFAAGYSLSDLDRLYEEKSVAELYPSLRGVTRTVPKWTVLWKGRVYRPVMKVMHRWGWCYMQRTYTAPENHWCHWCGMRGRR